MKKLKGSLLAKSVAVVLFCALCLAAAVSALGVGMLYSSGYFFDGAAASREDLAQTLCYNEIWTMGGVWPQEGVETPFNEAIEGNYRYEVYDSDGVLRYSSYQGEKTLASVTEEFSNWYSYGTIPQGMAWGETAGETASPTTEPGAAYVSAEPTPFPIPADPLDSEPYGRTVKYTVVCYLLSELKVNDSAAFQLRCFDRAAANSGGLIAAAVTGLLLAIALGVFLLCAAGHRGDTEQIRSHFVDRIPFDLFTALIAAAGAGDLYLIVQILDHLNRKIAFRLGVAAVLFVIGTLLFLLWCMSLAVRVKQKTLVKGTLLYKLVRLLGRALGGLWKWAKTLVASIPLVWRGLLIFLAAAFVGLIAAVANRHDAIGLWAAGNFILFPFVLWALTASRRLRDGAKEIARGNTEYRVDTKFLVGEQRRHAEDLNSIQDGVLRAGEERMRSERMKTELITNVSHDIKTPLTSIISYVDLLSKEELDNEKAKEYIEVLQRQSARLKKLTDDLVEASKASSGVLEVNMERCDLSVMLDQTAGEYGERLEAKGLPLVVRKPESSVFVMADARHTQRIFDNLMSNILKYAMSGTRVYIDLVRAQDGAAVIFRNTSANPVEQSGDELTERFVRGDSARGGEGSGLGLSIAKSLAELQGGTLKIDVDGDLFKVTLGFVGAE